MNKCKIVKIEETVFYSANSERSNDTTILIARRFTFLGICLPVEVDFIGFAQFKAERVSKFRILPVNLVPLYYTYQIIVHIYEIIYEHTDVSKYIFKHPKCVQTNWINTYWEMIHVRVVFHLIRPCAVRANLVVQNYYYSTPTKCGFANNAFLTTLKCIINALTPT